MTQHATSPNATVLLVQERLAEAAAEYAVGEDIDSLMPKLFTAVRPTVTYDEDPEKFVEQLQPFHLRFYWETSGA